MPTRIARQIPSLRSHAQQAGVSTVAHFSSPQHLLPSNRCAVAGAVEGWASSRCICDAIHDCKACTRCARDKASSTTAQSALSLEMPIGQQQSREGRPHNVTVFVL